MRTFSRLAEEIHPVVALSSAWPLILAIALRRTRWPQLLPAAAATFLILSIGGVSELSVELSHLRGYGGTVGSFHLTRRAFLNPTMTDLSLGILGATQLSFELATAIRAILLMARFRGASVPPTPKKIGRGARDTGVWPLHFVRISCSHDPAAGLVHLSRGPEQLDVRSRIRHQERRDADSQVRGSAEVR